MQNRWYHSNIHSEQLPCSGNASISLLKKNLDFFFQFCQYKRVVLLTCSLLPIKVHPQHPMFRCCKNAKGLWLGYLSCKSHAHI